MCEALLFAALLATAYPAFLLLALSQKQNWLRVSHDASAGTRPPAWPLRAAGCALLALALGIALVRDGAGFGPILWVISLAVAAGAAAATLTARPAWLRSMVGRLRVP
jgi:hypothetical protein